jgi:hypothetical protein
MDRTYSRDSMTEHDVPHGRPTHVDDDVNFRLQEAIRQTRNRIDKAFSGNEKVVVRLKVQTSCMAD